MDQLMIYRDGILKNFNTIENITGIMIQISHPDLEQKFWMASDSRDLNKLMFLKNQTDGLIDNLREK